VMERVKERGKREREEEIDREIGSEEEIDR
jgi:hypothetical protein